MPWYSWRSRQLLQKWPIREKTKTIPIVGAYGEDSEEEVVYAPYTQNEYAEIETRIWFQDFLDLLNEKDRQIVSLLEQGYTQEEIGVMLGYSNHSGVTKRIKYIRKLFEKFRNNDVELLKSQHAMGKREKANPKDPTQTNIKTEWEPSTTTVGGFFVLKI